MKRRSRHGFKSYVFGLAVIGTVLALLISITTKTTIAFRGWLVAQGLLVLGIITVLGIRETSDELQKRKFLDASITGLWYAILFAISVVFEIVYVLTLVEPASSPTSRLGFLIVVLVALFTNLILLVTALGFCRALLTELRTGWRNRRFAVVTKSTLYAVGVLLCLLGVYFLSLQVLSSR